MRKGISDENVQNGHRQDGVEAEEAGINQGVVGTKQKEQVDIEESRLKKEKVTRTEGHTGTINMMRNPNGRPTNTSVTSNTGLRHMRICNVKASLKMRGSVTTR